MRTESTVGSAPGAWPLVGHTPSLLYNPLRFVTSLPAHGDLVRIRIGPFEAIMVCAPELVRQVLLNDRVFDKDGPIFDRTRAAFGDGLATCPNGPHRRQRRLAQPCFHPARLPGYAEVMTKHIATITASWRDGQVLDVLSEMMTLTARTAVETLFSDALPPAMLGAVLNDFNALLGGIYTRTVVPPPLNKLLIVSNRRFNRARVRLREIIGRVIADHQANNADRGDLLSALLSARDPADSQGLSDTEILDQVMTFFLAGSETTADVLAWAVFLLAGHPDVEHQLHAEVDAILGGAAARFEDLPKLTLTGRVVTETLRVYPPAWTLARTATTDTHLGGHRIPAGSILFYSPYLLHHLPELYPDPDRFDPGRWTDGHRASPPREAFIPFAAGARKCIGDTFALTEATLALATLAARWRLRLPPGGRVHPARSVLLHPRGLRMRATPRGEWRNLPLQAGPSGNGPPATT
ncbi:MAG TPA: cytochrome P450 [Pseudonocardiaceae bacterium]|nr:cytochrome P450 [Pseudonocardiaceae bacterium]